MKPLAIAAGRTAALAAGRGPHLVAGVATVLQRYSDRGELELGYVEPGRPEPVPIRLSVGDDPSFPELVDRVRSAIAAAPGPARTENGAFDAVVALDQDPPCEADCPMWLAAHASPDGLRYVLHGNGGAPDDAAAQRLVSHLRTLLEGETSDPGRPISALPILTEAEREQLLVGWNDTRVTVPRRSVHELLREAVGAREERLAVACGEERLSFGELEARSNQMARHLAGVGVGPGVLVGVALERCAAMVVGLLGVLKAGGAYVPVDPTYPVARQEFMLQSSGAAVVLTQERLLAELPVGAARVVCVDRDWPVVAEMSSEPLEVESDPEDLAYVIYTSGSTGAPKGVQIPHRALVNFLISMRREPGLGPEDVLVAVTTLSFDIAGLELYLPLLAGATLVIAPGRTVSDPRALARLLDESGATVMQATPTTWRMLLDGGWRPRGALKALCGGEPLPVALAERLLEAGAELWNMYGPTETTIWSTCARVRAGEPLTIGRPIANTTVYVLDKHRQPVPVGVTGELWIGGAGLAHGYRGREDLTAERFVAHPFDPREDGSARIYRTGDLARYRADGNIDFLGRIDNQVKVRGFRIELGEIETALTRHPGIAEAVVVARGAAGADAELAAYVIPTGQAIAGHALREHCGKSLPPYMVPSTVTTLDAFPLTPNGKVDRKALPEPRRERAGERALLAPRTELERRLAAIWERELGVSPIGVTDDFFDLGVTSFTAATLFAAIEHELGGELPLGAIFRAPTIEALAALLARAAETARWTSLVPIQPGGSRPPIFCMHGGAGTILHLAALSRRLGPDQPFFALQSRGLYGGAPPLTTVEDMATHYLSEMRQVQSHGPWYLGGYCFGALVAFEIAVRLRAGGEEVKLLAMFNGPSTTWIKRWGWHGNQPGWLARHPRAPRPSEHERRRRKRAAIQRRLRRALQDPRRLWTGLLWQLAAPRTRLALALGRPIPEQLREQYFLDLHAVAERAYDPPVYPGEILVFYGEGLYEDPTLGWEPLAAEGVKTYAVPGDHTNNRQAMMEPAVGFVSERLDEHLAKRE